MLDCIIIGYNDLPFPDYVEMVRAMGTNSGAYRDLNLAFIELEGRPYRSMDVLNHFHHRIDGVGGQDFHNTDFLWPVVTYLSTFLARRGFSFDYVNLFHLEKDRLRELLQGKEVLAVAITTTLYVIPHPILEIVDFVRQHNPHVKIIVGGPYVSNQVRVLGQDGAVQLFKDLGADIYVISQEGELTLTRVLHALKEDTALSAVENIAYRDGPSYVLTQPNVESNSLIENMVDYSLFPASAFGEFVTLRTAKSCPFSCAFCGFPKRAGRYTYMGLDYIEQELNAIRDLGTVTTLTFIDDTFNVPKGRFKDILRLMIRNEYGFRWNSFYRSDHGDDETIDLMRAAGCEGVFLGVESGSDAMLERMNKSARQKNYRQAIARFREVGISTYASLIIGFPGETSDTVRETYAFLEDVRPDFFRAQLWYCDPITPIWDKRDEYDIRGSSFNWSHQTMDAKTACEWIEHLFLTVDNSIWLPQHGFEQWSTFYLQRKGMSLAQIQWFLRCFNAAVKEKLLHPHKRQIDQGILAALEQSCHFDRAHAGDAEAVLRLSGGRLAAAEQFWREQFVDVNGAGLLDGLRRKNRLSRPSSGDWTTCPSSTTWLVQLAEIAQTCQASPAAVLLAAFSLLLAMVGGQSSVHLLIIIHSGDTTPHAYPLRLRPREDWRFAAFVREVDLQLRFADTHRAPAFMLLAPDGGRSPAQQVSHVSHFDVAFAYTDAPEDNITSSPDEIPELPPNVRAGVDLLLSAQCKPDHSRVQLSGRTSVLDEGVVKQLAQVLDSVLEKGAANNSAYLATLLPLSGMPAARSDNQSDAQQEFRF